MKVEQIYTGCLAQGAYYIESDGEAVVIDPLREVDLYIQKAKRNNAKIKYVFETHFHADFVSGHLDVNKKTGARIVYGPGANPGFTAHIAKDGEEFKVGKVTFKVLHTPGHTMESTCYLLKDEKGKDVALFSGDTLFIGACGRVDLPGGNAEQLYYSLTQKLMALPDDTILFPGHNYSDRPTSTLGEEKQSNPYFQFHSLKQFLAAMGYR